MADAAPRYTASPDDYQQGLRAGAGPRSQMRGAAPHPRGRGWIVLLGMLVVLAVLFVVADQVAKAYVQNMIAGKIQSSAGLATKPSVSIKGF